MEKTTLVAECPFCRDRGFDPAGRLVVFLNQDGPFHGYFRCQNRCVPGGFPLWFARLAALDLSEAPGFDPEREYFHQRAEFPVVNINTEIMQYHDRLTDDLIQEFSAAGIGRQVLDELQIGYNGRYIVYPYFQTDGNGYTARCVFPDRPQDYFWHGDEQLAAEEFQIFNIRDLLCCENGALFLCEGENNLLPLKQLGFPGLAVPYSPVLESIDPEIFAHVRTLFIVMVNSGESETAARALAARIGYKVRLLQWPAGLPRGYSVWQMARDRGGGFRDAIAAMIQSAKTFSPFPAPRFEHERFLRRLTAEQGTAYAAMQSGFSRLDAAIGGIHGINVIGGAPKVGKSMFMIQIATEMALRGIPVLYYDFENGRQKIYQRTLIRLSRMDVSTMRRQEWTETERQRYDDACRRVRRMMTAFRVVNDRKLTPELMRRHIDFLRHETSREYAVVVIDSLHKLPFKDLSERRTGIDAWLRQLEAIRDELQVSFLVISELTRGGDGSYREEPHLGVFKGSGDIEYSADNAMVLYPGDEHQDPAAARGRSNTLWLVASREHSPGPVASYALDYPYWGFVEEGGRIV
ncbi:MAG: DnaB-like helicase C-terminal domain-containing protein [Desulfoprunum sp.]